MYFDEEDMAIERICKNCKLYDAASGTCTVSIIHEGEYYELPVLPTDTCFWEKEDIPINQIRTWSDGNSGFVETPESD